MSEQKDELLRELSEIQARGLTSQRIWLAIVGVLLLGLVGLVVWNFSQSGEREQRHEVAQEQIAEQLGRTQSARDRDALLTCQALIEQDRRLVELRSDVDGVVEDVSQNQRADDARHAEGVMRDGLNQCRNDLARQEMQSAAGSDRIARLQQERDRLQQERDKLQQRVDRIEIACRPVAHLINQRIKRAQRGDVWNCIGAAQ